MTWRGKIIALDIILVECMFEDLILKLGYAGLFAVVFAETGLLVGFFLPGDTLLFSAGLLAAVGVFQLPIVIAVCAVAAVVGDSVGYFLGSKYGRTLYAEKNSEFFKKEHLDKAEKFYEKHGPVTIVLARFVPIVRTFAPTIAGVARMHYFTFLTYNVLGGLLWVVSLTLLGFFFGGLIPNLADYISYVLVGIVLVSLVPLLFKMVSRFKKKRR